MFSTFKVLATDIQSLKLEQLHLMVSEKTITDENERIFVRTKIKNKPSHLHLMRELSEETRKSLEHHAEEIPNSCIMEKLDITREKKTMMDIMKWMEGMDLGQMNCMRSYTN